MKDLRTTQHDVVLRVFFPMNNAEDGERWVHQISMNKCLVNADLFSSRIVRDFGADLMFISV